MKTTSYGMSNETWVGKRSIAACLSTQLKDRSSKGIIHKQRRYVLLQHSYNPLAAVMTFVAIRIYKISQSKSKSCDIILHNKLLSWTILTLTLLINILSWTPIARGQVALNRQNNGETVKPEVIGISPAGDRRILISSKHGGAYPEPNYQTTDAKVRIEVEVQGISGQKVYFEVIDPNDASPYPPFSLDNSQNDNLDAGKKGTNYETFQSNCLPVREIILGGNDSSLVPNQTNRWKAWTTLNITSRYSGDNYAVRATTRRPNPGVYFHEQPKLTNQYLTSGTIFAWKRVYLEIDRMYRKGATILVVNTVDGNTDPDSIEVDDLTDFADLPIDSSLVLFKPDGTEVTRKFKGKNDTNKTILVEDVDIEFAKYSGVRLASNTEVVGVSNSQITADVSAAFGANTNGTDGGAFVEFVPNIAGSGALPSYKIIPNPDPQPVNFYVDPSVLTAFLHHWRGNRQNQANVIQIAYIHKFDAPIGGLAPTGSHISMVIMDNNNEQWARESTVHELGHHWVGGRFDSDHVDQYVDKPNIDNPSTDNCVMSYNSASNSVAKFDFSCLYRIRSAQDPF